MEEDTPRKILKSIFKHENFKSIHQDLGVHVVALNKYKNIIINMASQGGKSLCYQIPAMMQNGLTIVFTPALASIFNTVDYLKSLKINAATINKYTSIDDREEIMKQINMENSGIKFLLATPEMFIFEREARHDEWFKDLILKGKVNCIVVDEAHKVVDFAASRRAFDKLYKFRMHNLNVPWVALTTCDRDFEAEIVETLRMDNPYAIWSSSVVENIFYDAVKDDRDDDIISFFEKLKENDEIPSGIIFCGFKQHTLKTAEYLYEKGISCGIYHGDTRDQKDVLDKWFRREFPIIIATSSSFGFGINYNAPPVRFVIHFGMPEKFRSFYHESCRAGNDGNKAYSRVYNTIEFLKFKDISEDFDDYHDSPCLKKFLHGKMGEIIPKCKKWCSKCLGSPMDVN